MPVSISDFDQDQVFVSLLSIIGDSHQVDKSRHGDGGQAVTSASRQGEIPGDDVADRILLIGTPFPELIRSAYILDVHLYTIKKGIMGDGHSIERPRRSS